MPSHSLRDLERHAPSAAPGWVAAVHGAYWWLLLGILPLLLNPALLWSTSASTLQTIAYFRAISAWLLVGYGTLVVLLTRSELRMADVARSLPRTRLPFKFLWAFMLAVVVSTLFSNYGTEAPALGSSARADGTLMQIAWFSLALVSAELARTAPFRKGVFLGALTFGSAGTSLWILLQTWGADPLSILSRAHFYLVYAAGAFGHGGVASAYLAVSLVVLMGSWLRKDAGGVGMLVVVALLCAGMTAAGGRAAIVGFLIGSGLLVLEQLRLRRSRWYRLLVLFVVVVVGGVGGYVKAPHAQQQAANSEAIFSGSPGASLSHRFIAWRVAIRTIGKHPLWGVGPEGFAHTLWQSATPQEQRALLTEVIGFAPKAGSYTISGNAIVYSDPKTGRPVARQLDWDKAHNYLLDIALATGLPSMLLFLGFVLSALWALLRSRSSTARAIGYALVTFMIWGLGWFYSVALDPIAWGLVGAGLGLSWNARQTHTPPTVVR